MDKKKKIIIGAIILIIAAIILVMILTTVNYEKLEITPNGTTIEVPANQTEFNGEYEGIKIWNWNTGILVAYNNHDDLDNLNLGGVGFNALIELLKNAERQEIDGYTCYVINADDLFEIHIFDFIKINYKGKFYCIPLSNETTHDNIIICCNDQGMATHMAKSVKYKNVYPKSNRLNDVKSSIKDEIGDWQSQITNYTNSADFKDAQSSVQQEIGTWQSKANQYTNNTDFNNVKSSIQNKIGEWQSQIPISL